MDEIDPDARYSTALDALRIAEREYATAESNLIRARREAETAKLGSRYGALRARAASVEAQS